MKFQTKGRSAQGGVVANLIFAILALGLCGLCTFQFKKEGELRLAVEGLSRTNALVIGEREDARKEALRWKTEVTEATMRSATSDNLIRSNQTEIMNLKSSLRAATNEVASLTRSRDGFKERFEQQAAVAVRASEGSKKLKAEAEAEIQRIAAIAEERTATANKYAKDYQELVAACEKLRAELQAKPASPSK
jgi:hypothetical protein